jgi:hypothetical protein
MKYIGLSLLFVWANLQHFGSAFQAAHNLAASRPFTQLSAVSYDIVAEVGYGVSLQKPLGVVFGENPDPYFGLVVDDVSEGLNGGMAGLRIGDQLLSINGEVVIGDDFDTIMGTLQSAPSKLDLVMYRGSVASVYTILSNRIDEDDAVRDDDEGDEPVIMDENYETPVIMEVREQKPLSIGDVFKAMGKVGKMLTEDTTPPELKKEKKKAGGFFGMGGESIQLDGDAADTLK